MVYYNSEMYDPLDNILSGIEILLKFTLTCKDELFFLLIRIF